MALNGYYNRFNSEKKYVKALFIAGQGLQSAELNEIQDFNLEALKKIFKGRKFSKIGVREKTAISPRIRGFVGIPHKMISKKFAKISGVADAICLI